jgi:hypothetical protein
VPARGYAQALQYCFNENCNGRSSTAPATTLSVICGQAILLKGQIARFLHNHKNDQQNSN